jgi:glycosyltransferase involved in cell wall biosynthesis
MKKILRISTIPKSLNTFCRGQLHMISERFEVVAVSSPDPELETIREREGVRTIAVPMERHISLWRDIKALIKMIGVMRRERPDIVHSITPKAGLVSMMAAWLARVPVRMHTYTGLVFPTSTGMKQRILIWMDKLLCRCATYINPEGQGVADDLKRFHITKKPLHIIGNGNVRGVDMDYWNRDQVTRDVRKELDIVPTDIVLLFVGRLVRDKGINELIEAFSKIGNEHVKLILVGSYEDALDPLAKKTMQHINSDKRIFAVGRQEDVRPYYTASDIFVFPSYREGFPNTVLEAGALGLPSIVTDINGAREIIIEGKNGIIIPSKNVDVLCEAMKRMIDNPDLRQKLASQARELVASRYEQKWLWGELMKVYDSLVSKN